MLTGTLAGHVCTSGAAKNGVQPFSLAAPIVGMSSTCIALPKSASFTTRPLLKTRTLRAASEKKGRWKDKKRLER